MSRPMTELPECAVCDRPIFGARGDWFHDEVRGGRGAYDLPQQQDHLAAPKRVPAPLQPIIDDVEKQLARASKQVAGLAIWLEELKQMQRDEAIQ